MRAVPLALALLLLPLVAHGQDAPPPKWSTERFSGGIEGGYALTRDFADVQTVSSGLARVPFSYNLGRLSIVAAGAGIFSSGIKPRYELEGGLRAHLLGTNSDDDRFQIAVGGGVFYLFGSGYDALQASFNEVNGEGAWKQTVFGASGPRRQ